MSEHALKLNYVLRREFAKMQGSVFAITNSRLAKITGIDASELLPALSFLGSHRRIAFEYSPRRIVVFPLSGKEPSLETILRRDAAVSEAFAAMTVNAPDHDDD